MPRSRTPFPAGPGRRPRSGRIAPLLWFAAWAVPAFGLSLGLGHRLDQLRQPAAETGVQDPAAIEDHALFAGLRDQGLIVRGKDGRLTIPEADWGLRHLQAVLEAGAPPPFGGREWRERRKLVAALHGTDNGRHVRTQIGLWNSSRAVVAIRDNRRRGHAGQVPVFPPVNTPWTAAAVSGPESGRRLDRLALTPPASFDAFARTMPVGMANWQVFPGEDGRAVKVATRLLAPLPAEGVEIQILGRVRPGTLPPGARLTPLCGGADCAMATVYVAGGSPGDVEVSLEVEPVPLDRSWFTRGMIQLSQDKDGGLHWLPRTRPPSGTVPAQVTTADGVALTAGEDGRPTADAAALGLLPVIGHGRSDRRGVSGLLDGRVDRFSPATVALTIDSRVQRAANQALAEAMAEPFGTAKAPDPYAGQRRASIVALDPQTGAILAGARWPRPPSGLHPWDASALSHLGGTLDPLAPIAWQGMDSDNAPGSTFKLVTALALQAATDTGDEAAIGGFLAGCPPNADGGFSCLGLRTGTIAYSIPPQTHATHNFRSPQRGFTPVGDSLRAGEMERAPVCVEGRREQTRSFGLPQAIRDSVNVYFVRGAELLDADAARRYDAAMRRLGPRTPLPAPPASRLADTIRAAGFEHPVDLAGAARPFLGNLHPAGGARSVLEAEAAQIDLLYLLDRRADTPWRSFGAVDVLSQTAMGQRVLANPLHMASLAAGLAAGELPVPHLFAAWNGQALAPPARSALPAADVSLLRRGLKMVPEVGTAAGRHAFGRWAGTPADAARCHVYGKTGTGEVDAARSRTTMWFVGWAAAEFFSGDFFPAPGGEKPAWSRPVAFACQVTHGVNDRRTGGATCAPIIARFLELLARPDAALSLSQPVKVSDVD
ncbi:penicillin-binding transpeptidase domain-containing protein [Azospirillum agricola]|uniref:penicillin-binding transpeptidase domain-containing protein n=1 Tax=Azospirillum agricola TaxID=1720247 RepID=UPI000A0F3CF7|nr:penicillin-binding transpeptidase domain-containing protein [Azospirillum agricola]SMH31768.1 Penicillin binding protein transpeptidase domain-containing protein [Azospirillum lipoferum]